ncbi:hypothetical protein NKF06_02950 [Haloferax sp. AB510]|uniref:hypothetical protein n=1 Tax=Haloferax sp. AB510 TaxID=2934172 RepID=UPI00209BED7E|nr:hypothetical protein [Haloferax sp. AB510]MCO8265572.1 hypothetical protein [Haloferax sp. AB510]
MDDAVLQRFAVVLALVGVALHLAALAENPSQGFLTVGFGVLLLALALAARRSRANCSRQTRTVPKPSGRRPAPNRPAPNRPTPTDKAEPLAATRTL